VTVEQPHTTAAIHNNVQLLGVYTYYRLFLSLLLGSMFWLGIGSNVLGSEYPAMFERGIIAFIITSLITLLFFWWGKLKPSTQHVSVLLIVDFIALILLIYASGGVDSGLGYLLLISMAIGSIFIQGQINIGLAALAALLIMSMSVINSAYGSGSNQSIFSAGITGILLFVTAITFRLLTNRIQISEQVALEQAKNVASIQQLAERIIEHMRTGIVVLDKNLKIQLINGSATRLLGLEAHQQLDHISALHTHLQLWPQANQTPEAMNLNAHQAVKISFSALQDANKPSLMLFIEDTQQLNQEVQQLKLASLGRLTASIAHEIRNPLSAISHASQLLNETENLDSGDARLLNIIHNHTQRINHIITNVLQMSRRQNAKPEVLDLKQWLVQFKEDYLRHNNGEITLNCQYDQVQAKVDQSHLHQIVSNLVDNGMRYNQQTTQNLHVSIIAYIDSATELPYIDIIDNGPGINEELAEQIFEPFFTTEVTGSGLGLYLCKELCHANQAKLSYRRIVESHQMPQSCFTIQLCHYLRNI